MQMSALLCGVDSMTMQKAWERVVCRRLLTSVETTLKICSVTCSVLVDVFAACVVPVFKSSAVVGRCLVICCVQRLSCLIVSVQCQSSYWTERSAKRALSNDSVCLSVCLSVCRHRWCLPCIYRVPTGPEKSWNFSFHFAGPEKSWNWTLVLKKSWILLLSSWKTKIMNL